VVDHYSRGGEVKTNLSPDMKPLNLSQREKEDLVAFLQSLTSCTVLINYSTFRPQHGHRSRRAISAARVPAVAWRSSPERGVAFVGEPRGRKSSGRAGTSPSIG